MTGREVWLKAENLQRTGSFKIRGAVNCIASLSDEERAAVSSPSAGNHAQAWRGRRARPDRRDDLHAAGHSGREGRGDAELRRQDRARRGDVRRRAGARARARRDERRDVRPPVRGRAGDRGQGTIGLELVEQLPDVGTVVVPIGGAGFRSGIAIAAKELKPACASSACRLRRARRSPVACHTASRSRKGSRSSSPES